MFILEYQLTNIYGKLNSVCESTVCIKPRLSNDDDVVVVVVVVKRISLSIHGFNTSFLGIHLKETSRF